LKPTAEHRDDEAQATPFRRPVPAGRVSEFQVAPPSVVASSTPLAVMLVTAYVMLPPTTQQFEELVQVIPDRTSIPDGTLRVCDVLQPSVVASTTGTPLGSVARAQQSEATGQDIEERLTRPFDDTAWVAHVLPPSVVARIKPGPPYRKRPPPDARPSDTEALATDALTAGRLSAARTAPLVTVTPP
jgi:hypothetical protein